MRMRHTLAAVAALAMLALAGPTTATALPPAQTLGPSPAEADCLSWSSTTQGCYYDIGYIDYSVGDHMVKVGDHFSATTTGSSAFGNWAWHHPPGTSIVSCTPSSGGGPQGTGGTCEYVATAPTGGWVPGPASSGRTANWSGFFGASFSCCTIGTYTDGDYLAIIGPNQREIDGTVVDNAGAPVSGAQIDIVGTDSSNNPVGVSTPSDASHGYYNAIVNEGTYDVSGSFAGHPLCLASVKSQCIEVKHGVSPDANISFRRDGFAEINGTVTNLKDQAAPGVLILVYDNATGKHVGDGATNSQGKYRIDLEKSGTYKVVALHGDDLFDPENRIVSVNTGEDKTADFKVYDALKVQIESGYVRGPENDFITRLSVTNNSSTATVTDLTPVNQYAVQVAGNAFPPGETGHADVKQLIPLGTAQPSQLAPGQTWQADLRLNATQAGKVGLRAKFSGKVEISSVQHNVSDSHDAEITIDDPKGEDPRKSTNQATQAIEMYIDRTAAKFREIRAREARETYKDLRKQLSPEQEKMWFGSSKELKITEGERALALFTGLAPEQVAIANPNRDRRDLTAADQFALYNGARAAADLKNGREYFTDHLGKPLGAIYGAGANEFRYWSQVGSAEGRAQISADLANYWDAEQQDLVINKDAAITAFFGSGQDAQTSLQQSKQALTGAISKANAGMEAAVAANEVHQHQFNTRLADLMASGHYLEAQTMMAQRDSDIENAVSTVVADDLMGRAAFSVGGAVLSGTKSGLAKVVKGIGAARKGGAQAVAESTELGSRARAGLPTYLPDLPEDSRVAIGMDRLRNMGGISGKDASIARRNVAEVNRLAREQFGDAAPTGELFLRPVNPFEVAGAMAKVEVVGVKSINPIDTLLGASPKSLGQPGIYNPIEPTSLPKWSSYAEAEQLQILDRYKIKQSEFTQRHGYAPPGSKMAEMKAAINGRTKITVEGQYAEQTRVYDLELHTQNVDGTEILSYKHLEINGDVITTGKPRPIGVDLDDFMWGAKGGGKLPPEVEDFMDTNFDRLGRQAAKDEGYSEPFHGQTLRRMSQSDMSVEAYPSYAHYGLRHLPEREARQVAKEIAERYNAAFPGREPMTVDKVLKEIRSFGQKAIKVTEDDVIFGDPGILFADP